MPIIVTNDNQPCCNLYACFEKNEETTHRKVGIRGAIIFDGDAQNPRDSAYLLYTAEEGSALANLSTGSL